MNKFTYEGINFPLHVFKDKLTVGCTREPENCLVIDDIALGDAWQAYVIQHTLEIDAAPPIRHESPAALILMLTGADLTEVTVSEAGTVIVQAACAVANTDAKGFKKAVKDCTAHDTYEHAGMMSKIPGVCCRSGFGEGEYAVLVYHDNHEDVVGVVVMFICGDDETNIVEDEPPVVAEAFIAMVTDKTAPLESRLVSIVLDQLSPRYDDLVDFDRDEFIKTTGPLLTAELIQYYQSPAVEAIVKETLADLKETLYNHETKSV